MKPTRQQIAAFVFPLIDNGADRQQAREEALNHFNALTVSKEYEERIIDAIREVEATIEQRNWEASFNTKE